MVFKTRDFKKSAKHVTFDAIPSQICPLLASNKDFILADSLPSEDEDAEAELFEVAEFEFDPLS